MATKYSDRRKLMLEYLGNKCAKCGSVSDLEIDHIDPTTKNFSLSKAFSYKWDTIQAELDLCQLLCYNCHYNKTSLEKLSYQTIGFRCFEIPTDVNRQTVHGTSSGYMHRKCRCPECKAWQKQYFRKRYLAEVVAQP